MQMCSNCVRQGKLQWLKKKKKKDAKSCSCNSPRHVVPHHTDKRVYHLQYTAAMTLWLLFHGRFHGPDLEVAHINSIYTHWRDFNMSIPTCKESGKCSTLGHTSAVLQSYCQERGRKH